MYPARVLRRRLTRVEKHALKNHVWQAQPATGRRAQQVRGLVIGVIGQPQVGPLATGQAHYPGPFGEDFGPEPGTPIDESGSQATDRPDLVAAALEEFHQAGGRDQVARRMGMIERFEGGIEKRYASALTDVLQGRPPAGVRRPVQSGQKIGQDFCCRNH